MQMPIPADWNGEGYCRVAVCWPDSVLWLGILNGLLSMPSQGRFWDASTGSIIDVQNAFRETYNENFNLQEVIMACGDTGIAAALEAIASAIAAGGGGGNATAIAQCGGGGGGTQSISNSTLSIQTYVTLGDGTVWPVMGSAPIATIPESGYPVGYTDVEEYDADKCRKATKMADDWIASIENFALVNWAAGVAGAATVIACLVGLIAVPYATIPLLLFALVGNGLITTALSAMADYLQDRREDVICILYEGETVEIIITQIAELLDVVIAAIDPVAAVGIALKNIALWLMNGDTLNVLFSSAAAFAYPDADCSSCADPCEDGPFVLLLSGTGPLTFDGSETTYNSTFYAPLGFSYITLVQSNEYGDPPTDDPCCNFTVEIVSVSGSCNWEVANSCEGSVGTSDPVTAGQCHILKDMRFVNVSGTPFSVTVRLTSPPIACE